MAEAHHDGDGGDKAWVATQRKTFVKYFNTHLKKKQYGEIVVEQVASAFETGEKLMEIINALYELPIPKHKANPQMRPQKMDVLGLAFKMVEEANIKTNFLQVHHLLDHNEKMVLGLLWAIILDYAIKGISVDDSNAKEGLLLWVQKKTKGYNHVDPPTVTNFSTSWSNGLAFCALIHRHRPNMIDYASLDPKNAAHNLELAFSTAEQLGIPRLLDVEDLTGVPRPDERSVMTQVSEYFRVFAAESVKETAAQRLANLVRFMREIEDRQNNYVARSRDLLQWVGEKKAALESREFGHTLEEAVAATQRFRTFVVDEKPAKVGERMDVEQLFAEIQTELAVNQRFAFVPPEDVAPDRISHAFDELADAEKGHGKAVRDNRFRFVSRKEVQVPEEKRQEIESAFRHFDKNGNNSLDVKEFQAALTALGVPFKDEADVARVYERVSEGSGTINFDQYLRYNLSLVEDKDSPEQTAAAFQLLADQSPTVTRDQLSIQPLEADDVAFLERLMANHRNEDGSYNFQAFIDSHFKPL